MLKKEDVLKRANEIYAARKVAKYGESQKYAKISIDTAHAILEALVEAFNSRVTY